MKAPRDGQSVLRPRRTRRGIRRADETDRDESGSVIIPPSGKPLCDVGRRRRRCKRCTTMRRGRVWARDMSRRCPRTAFSSGRCGSRPSRAARSAPDRRSRSRCGRRVTWSRFPAAPSGAPGVARNSRAIKPPWTMSSDLPSPLACPSARTLRAVVEEDPLYPVSRSPRRRHPLDVRQVEQLHQLGRRQRDLPFPRPG